MTSIPAVPRNQIQSGDYPPRSNREPALARPTRGYQSRLAGLVLTVLSLLLAPAAPRDALAQADTLPMYGVDFNFAPAWVDGSGFPGQLTHGAVNDTFLQSWEELDDQGFNFIRVPVDIGSGTAGAIRAANLCHWARTQGVYLVPMLHAGSPDAPVGPALAGQTAKFVGDLVQTLAQAGSDSLQTYEQILMFQIGSTPDHPAFSGGQPVSAVAAHTAAAATALREAETAALSAHGLNPRPILVTGSFDAALISAGGAWQGALTDDNFNLAFARLNEFLEPIAASPSVDVIGFSWHPGSLSAGGAEQFPTLTDALLATYPGMQLLVTTGYSTAFSNTDEQRGYHSRVLQNLADYQSAAGPESLFLGMVLSDAFDHPSPSQPPSDVTGFLDDWDPSTAASGLTQLWGGGSPNPMLAWWQAETIGRMGLLAAQQPAAQEPPPATGAESAPETATGDSTTATEGESQIPPPAAPPPATGDQGAGLAGLGAMLQGIVEQAVVEVTDQAVQEFSEQVSNLWARKEPGDAGIVDTPSQGYDVSSETRSPGRRCAVVRNGARDGLRGNTGP